MAENPYRAPVDPSPARLTRPRSKWLAAIGSLVVPGLGQLYVGRTKRAIGWLVALILGVPIVLVVLLVLGLDPAYALVGTAVGSWSLRIIGSVDALRLVSRANLDANRVPAAGGYVVYLVAWLGLSQGVAFVVETHFVHPYSSSSRSMEPTLQVGDHFVATAFAERDRLVQRGDLIVFLMPGNHSVSFVKRVVGLPGETLVFEGGGYTVDGKPIPQEPCGDFEGCVVERVENGNSYRVRVNQPQLRIESVAETFVVPEGHVFAVGDNRYESYDSREFGPVPLSSLRGRVRSLLRPLSRLGPIPGATTD